MRTAIISDIHGNLAALEAVLADLRANGIERIVCLGDVAATGPQPGQ
ncbi:MAG: metallophosphatase family protein, partial [Anaerolineae bacterium]|nr:metallophosphatase family protein [Anaerolineae bacterium]